MQDPAVDKLLAEAKYYEAQAAKLHVDVRQATGWNRFWSISAELAKVGGALVLGLGGVIAAVTGSQLAEAKKEHLEAQIERRQLELEKIQDTYVTAQNEQDIQNAAVQRQLVELQAELAKAEEQAPTGSASNAPAIAAAVVKADAAQRSAKEVAKIANSAKRDVNNAFKKLSVPRF